MKSFLLLLLGATSALAAAVSSAPSKEAIELLSKQSKVLDKEVIIWGNDTDSERPELSKRTVGGVSFPPRCLLLQ
ncbi:hypothetical protein ABW19_dt0207025 [Dactylella cylindrospora]|nr:hypothetical protein ABW19_dt0207025 [Dactylella cylindrospora]